MKRKYERLYHLINILYLNIRNFERMFLITYSDKKFETYIISGVEGKNFCVADVNKLHSLKDKLIGKEIYIVHNHPHSLKFAKPSELDHSDQLYLEVYLNEIGLNMTDYLIYSKSYKFLRKGIYSFKKSGHLQTGIKNRSSQPLRKIPIKFSEKSLNNPSAILRLLEKYPVKEKEIIILENFILCSDNFCTKELKKEFENMKGSRILLINSIEDSQKRFVYYHKRGWFADIFLLTKEGWESTLYKEIPSSNIVR